MNTRSHLLKALIVSIIFLSILSCNQEPYQTKEIIKKDQLPTTAHAFVNRYFPGSGYSRIDKNEIALNDGSLYEVQLINGVEILFDANGTWIDINGIQDTKIPSEIIPKKIINHVENYFPEHFIQAIDTEANHFEIRLSNKKSLVFDNEGELVSSIE